MVRAFQFSSKWATELVPGIGNIVGERASCHAMAICRSVAPWAFAAAAIGVGVAWREPGIAREKNGMKAMPREAQKSTMASCPSMTEKGLGPSVFSPAAVL